METIKLYDAKNPIHLYFHNNNPENGKISNRSIIVTADTFNIDPILNGNSYQTITEIEKLTDFRQTKISILKFDMSLQDQLHTLKQYEINKYLEDRVLIIQLPIKEFMMSLTTYKQKADEFNNYYKYIGGHNYLDSYSSWHWYKLTDTDIDYLQILNKTCRNVVHIETTKDLANITPQTEAILCELPKHQWDYFSKIYKENLFNKGVPVYVLPNESKEQVPSFVELLATKLLVLAVVITPLVYFIVKTPTILTLVINVISAIILLTLALGSLYITRNILDDYRVIKERKLKGWTFMYTLMLLTQLLLTVPFNLILGMKECIPVSVLSHILIVFITNIISNFDDFDGIVNKLSHFLAKKGMIK